MARTSRTSSKAREGARGGKGRLRGRSGLRSARSRVRGAASARPAGASARPAAAKGARGPVRAADEAVELEAATLSEEEQIESAKYLPRHFPKRLFEEERFIFPETYGVNRVRLLVKDPQWLFAYWDLDPRAVNDLRNELGERALALTRLTLRITDPANGGASVILLPYGARAWYVRADAAARTYRAQIGWTLPSGEFRLIAESNPATTPRLGPSPVRATRRMRFTESPEALARAAAAEAGARPGPLGATPGAHGSEGGRGGKKRARGGASDVYRR